MATQRCGQRAACVPKRANLPRTWDGRRTREGASCVRVICTEVSMCKKGDGKTHTHTHAHTQTTRTVGSRIQRRRSVSRRPSRVNSYFFFPDWRETKSQRGGGSECSENEAHTCLAPKRPRETLEPRRGEARRGESSAPDPRAVPYPAPSQSVCRFDWLLNDFAILGN